MPDPIPARPAPPPDTVSGDGATTADIGMLPADAALTQQAPLPLALPSHGGRLSRVQQHATGLAEDVKEWVELRIKLVQVEAETFVQRKIQTLVMRMIPLIMAGIAGLFLLVTIALFLGWWLGHAAWGFLILTVLLLAVAGGLMYYNRDTLENPLAGAEMDAHKDH